MYAILLAVMKLVITTKSMEPTFIPIWKRKSMEQYSAVPYLAILINCLVWTLYGLPFINPGSILIVTISGSRLKKRIKVVLAELVFISILTLLTLTLTHSHKKRSTIVGTICILFNIMIYAVPLAVMKLVITTKSVEKSMEQYSSVPYLATVINRLVWTLYGLPFIHPGSILVVTINGSGFVIECTYLIIFLIF
ncbi:hypothetical protein F8388_002706 [Cannabis sativa]|uniref:Uncharacterized protein n=1 Tax=Cannabis sativa TaxID=3483 RepID=A0A7J6DSE7_CANSA|nr:hypothetical protein F8388_002706 [Cannabis sativa]KAF4374399.1 hypothetical protein G4B88_026286 [Cannabis sativa]